jgi:signal transduction histidine kinase
LVFIVAMASGLLVEHQLHGRLALFTLGPGLVAGLLFAAVAGLAAQRTAQALREVRDAALSERADPGGVRSVGRRGRLARRLAWALPGLRTSAELSELTHLIDTMRLRVRLADEVAMRHQRSAETASAGMFELLSGLVAAEEGARGQLSAELHDTVAQSLSQAGAQLERGQIADAADHLAEAEEQVRAVMARTRPPALRDGDLAMAVATLRADFARRYGLDVTLRWPPEPRPLPLATAVTVYRFFQEALLNVVKHCDDDRNVIATLRFDGDHLEAVVTDQGPGFDPTQVRADRGRHVGLGLLGERARLVGGQLEVRSRPGSGTTLRLRLPVPLTPPAPVTPPATVPATLPATLPATGAPVADARSARRDAEVH